jgi:hypothetical protein
MNDAGLMGAGETVGHLRGDRENPLDRKRPGMEQLPQGLALDQLHR